MKKLIMFLLASILLTILITAFEDTSNYQKPLKEGTQASKTENSPVINNLIVIFGASSSSIDYEAAKLIKTRFLSDYNIVFIRDVDYQDDGISSIISIGGSCVNKISAQLISSGFPTCGSSFTSTTKVSTNQYLIKTSSLPNNRIAILIAGYEGEDTWKGAYYFTTLNINNLTADINLIKNV